MTPMCQEISVFQAQIRCQIEASMLRMAHKDFNALPGMLDDALVRLGKILHKGCPQASFIPEIWQGHKNGWEGFGVAMERLEGTL